MCAAIILHIPFLCVCVGFSEPTSLQKTLPWACHPSLLQWSPASFLVLYYFYIYTIFTTFCLRLTVFSSLFDESPDSNPGRSVREAYHTELYVGVANVKRWFQTAIPRRALVEMFPFYVVVPILVPTCLSCVLLFGFARGESEGECCAILLMSRMRH